MGRPRIIQSHAILNGSHDESLAQNKHTTARIRRANWSATTCVEPLERRGRHSFYYAFFILFEVMHKHELMLVCSSIPLNSAHFLNKLDYACVTRDHLRLACVRGVDLDRQAAYCNWLPSRARVGALLILPATRHVLCF